LEFHASGRTSLRQMLEARAWKRRSRLRLAAMYSRRWSSRTFSMGLLGLATMPSRLPPYARMTKAGSLPSSGLLGRRRQYYEPLGLPPSTIPLRHRLIGTAFARRGPPGRVSPVPYQAVLTCPPPYPAGVLHRSGPHGCSLLPSPWNERLGHPSFRVFMSRGCKVHLMLGPPTRSLRRGLTASSRLGHPARTSNSHCSPGTCYAALRRLPRRDFHPQV
jgi:hypothetical protein